ncbi:unnamed protein product [Penicillium manginii]
MRLARIVNDVKPLAWNAPGMFKLESLSTKEHQYGADPSAEQLEGPSGTEMPRSGLSSQRDEARAISSHPSQPAQAGSSLQPEMGSLQSQFQVFDDISAPSGSRLNQSATSGAARSPIVDSISPNATTGRTPASESTYNKASVGQSQRERYMSSESVSQRSEKEEFQDIFSELTTGSEHELAFLSRHFTEIIAPWLDLSDSTKFFSVYVPIRAINSPSLKYAIAALAAKQLGRVKGNKLSAGGGMFTSSATTEMYPNAAETDWFLKAANYYYMAASDMNNSSSFGYSAHSSAVLESPIEIVSRWLKVSVLQGGTRDPSNGGKFLRKTEEILATAVLLIFYKLLDADGDQWPTHLTGIRGVFETLMSVDQLNLTAFTHGIRACFWNLARQDYLGSYFTRCPTHFDPTNLPMWRAAGISIDENEKFQISLYGSSNLSQEDQAANGICWLVSKVINFLAESKQSQIAQWTGSPSNRPAGNQESPGSADQSASTWLDLCFDFQTWFERVPETFRPCVRIDHPRDFSHPSENIRLPFPEVFFSLSTCAATMQHYHFGRIALLINQPEDVVSAPSTAFDRLQGYREVTKEVEYRTREACGIALGRPQGDVRVHMVPVLLALGQCLETPDEHQIILNLLRGVEAELGWATEYIVTKLEASWNR